MRNLCLAFVFVLLQAVGPGAAAQPAAATGPAAPAPGVDSTAKVPAVAKDSARIVPDTAGSVAAPAVPAAAPESLEAAPAAPAVAPSPVPGASTVAANPSAAPGTPTSRALFQDYTLVAQQYAFGVAAQVVAGALGFFIGSGLETAIVGEDEAHQGTLSFTGIRYDNFSGAFWGGTIGGFAGSSLAVYFTGQSNEEDGGYFWTLFGTALAGSGALYLADLMGVEEEADWKPFIPLLAIPTAGGILGFSASRWFSDRKRESIMGPDAGLRVHPPRFAMSLTPNGERFQLQALNLSF